MQLIIALTLSCVLTYTAFSRNRALLGISASAGWVFLSFASYQMSTAQWDWYYLLMFFSAIVAVAIFFESMNMRFGKNNDSGFEWGNTEDKKEEEDEEDKPTTYENPQDKRRRKLGLPPIHTNEAKWRREERDLFRNQK